MQKIILKDNLSKFHTLISYPDGQKSVKLNLDKLNVKEQVEIICGIKNFCELEVLLCLIAALECNDFMIHSICFKYLFGLRSDRVFSIGEPNYLRDVLAPILSKIPYRKFILGPHSDRALYYINDIKRSYGYRNAALDLRDNILIIGGDSSTNVGALLYIDNGPYIFFDKKRNDEALKVSMRDEFFNKIITSTEEKLLIVDDLCDGGATFIEEAKYLRNHFPHKKLELFIYHGLFSNGVDHVAKHFDHIYCTNSFQDINHPKVTCMDVYGE